MKRSRTAVLLLMSAVPLLLTACDDNSAREGMYTSVDACVAQTNDRATCKQAFDKAQKDALTTAPRFASQQECETDYGSQQCTQRNDGAGHSFFGPLMAGFFLSQMMHNRSPLSGFQSGPVFRDRRGDWQQPAGGGGGSVAGGFRSGGTEMARMNAPVDRAVTVSRSGFGRLGGRGFGS
jgi:uncharacterized protein YgiB involved in biofilm formation